MFVCTNYSRLTGEDIEDACQEVYGTEGYKSHWSEELVGDAAAAEAVKAYETLSESRGNATCNLLILVYLTYSQHTRQAQQLPYCQGDHGWFRQC